MRYLYAPVFFFGFIGAALAVAMNTYLFWLLPLLVGIVLVAVGAPSRSVTRQWSSASQISPCQLGCTAPFMATVKACQSK